MASRMALLTSASVAALVCRVLPTCSMSAHGEKAITAPGTATPSACSWSTVEMARLPPAESPVVVMSPP